MNLWDWKAKNYDFFRNRFPFNLLVLREIKNIKALLSAAKLSQYRILDVGTGTGSVLRLFPHHCQVFAVDKSYGMLSKARRKGNKNLVVADSTRLPFKSESFTLITAIGIFEYQEHRHAFLNELCRVMASAGYLVLTYSQFGFLNLLRNLLLQRVYLINLRELGQLLSENGYRITRLKRSCIQRQVLATRGDPQREPYGKQHT